MDDVGVDQHLTEIVGLCLVLVDRRRARGDDLLPLLFRLGVAQGW